MAAASAWRRTAASSAGVFKSPARNFGQRRAAAFLLFRQTSLVLHQCRGKRREGSGGTVAGPHHRHSPGIHLL